MWYPTEYPYVVDNMYGEPEQCHHVWWHIVVSIVSCGRRRRRRRHGVPLIPEMSRYLWTVSHLDDTHDAVASVFQAGYIFQ